MEGEQIRVTYDMLQCFNLVFGPRLWVRDRVKMWEGGVKPERGMRG